MSRQEDLLCEIRNLLKLQAGSNVGGSTRPVPIKGTSEVVTLAVVSDIRTEIWLHNASASVLYIGLTDDIDTDKYALRIASYDTLILNAQTYRGMYKKEIYGFWDSAAATSSKCMVTEFYKS